MLPQQFNRKGFINLELISPQKSADMLGETVKWVMSCTVQK